MPSARDLKRRITSVKSTQQITRAMKMVSAAKLRRSQEAIVNLRPYAKKIGELIQLASGLPNVQTDHPAFRQNLAEEGKGKRTLVLLVTSDRGLCGGFNSSLIKATWNWIQTHKGSGEIQVAFVGKKGAEFFKRRGYSEKFFSEFGSKVTFDKAAEVSNWALEYFGEGKCDEVLFVYNEFKNAMVQTVKVERFLPVTKEKTEISESAQPGAPHSAHTTGDASHSKATPENILVRPDGQTLLNELLSKHFSLQFFRVFLESQASEHGARMSAMENATKNAGDVIKKLTLIYNKQRQAGITKELLEIVAGSEAQKN